MLFRQTVVKGPIRHSEGPASAPYFAKLTFSETLPDTSTLPPCPLFVKGLFSAAGSQQVLADAGHCTAMRAAGGSGRDTTPPAPPQGGGRASRAGRGHAGSGRRREARPSGRRKRKEARTCGPLSQNRSDNTSCPVGAYSSYHFPQRLSSGRPHHTRGLTARRPGTALPGHRPLPPSRGRL